MIFSDITDESTPKEEKHFEIENDQPIIQTEDYKGLPPHEFTYRYTIDDKNDFKWVANLIIKPYVFSKKRRGRNGTWYWYCCDCRDQDCSTAAISKETLGPDGKPINELISADSNHVCNPCPSRHLKLLFRNQMNDIILQNPWMTAAEAYETAKSDMCESMDPALQKVFLDNVQNVAISAEMLRRLKRGLVKMSHSDEIVCEMCGHKANDFVSMGKHRKEKHPDECKINKSNKCDTCGKTFLQHANLVIHIKNVHNILHEDFAKIKAFSCDLCEYVALKKQSLDIHVSSVHLKLRPFECDICQKHFSGKVHLKRHKKDVHKMFQESMYL